MPTPSAARWAALPDAAPLTAPEFARLLDALGPLEPHPALAVAVSGGADSLALVHLAREAVGLLGGRLCALTVDHGLRPGSDAEATRVGGWMQAAGIRHEILTWQGPRPEGNLQAAARAARYALLDDWCGTHGILHLLTAHHAGDQQETQVLRLARRAGAGGLAGMSAVEPLERCQILRPLLPVPRARLVASVRARGLAWIDDPSNADRRFDRTRVRDGLHGVDGAPGVDGAWADTRTRGETALAWLMARAVAPSPLGSARLARAEFAAAEPALAVRALGAVVATLGGSAYPPRHHRLRTVLDHWLTDGGLGARTLGGCRLAAGPDGCLTVTREAGRIATRSALAPGTETLWDGRFRLQTAAGARGLTAARLNDGDWRQLRRDLPWIERTAPARAVRAGLPAVFDGDRFVGLPSLGAWIERPAAPGPGPVSAVFAPRRALSRAGFVGPVSLVCDAVSVV